MQNLENMAKSLGEMLSFIYESYSTSSTINTTNSTTANISNATNENESEDAYSPKLIEEPKQQSEMKLTLEQQTSQEIKKMSEELDSLQLEMNNNRPTLNTINENQIQLLNTTMIENGNNAQNNTVEEINFDINWDGIQTKEGFLEIFKKGELLMDEIVTALVKFDEKKLNKLIPLLSNYSILYPFKKITNIALQACTKKDKLRVSQILMIIKRDIEKYEKELCEKQKIENILSAENAFDINPQDIIDLLKMITSRWLKTLNSYIDLDENIYFNPKILSLFDSIDKNDKESIEKLISEKSFDINEIHLNKRCNALFYAIKSLNYDIVQFLLNSKANPHAIDYEYGNALDTLFSCLTNVISASVLNKSIKFDSNNIQKAEKILDLLICYGYSKHFSHSDTYIEEQLNLRDALVMHNILNQNNMIDNILLAIEGFFSLAMHIEHPISLYCQYRSLAAQKDPRNFVIQRLDTVRNFRPEKFKKMCEEIAQEKALVLFKYKSTKLEEYLNHDTTNLVLSYIPIDSETAENRLKEGRTTKFWIDKIDFR